MAEALPFRIFDPSTIVEGVDFAGHASFEWGGVHVSQAALHTYRIPGTNFTPPVEGRPAAVYFKPAGRDAMPACHFLMVAPPDVPALSEVLSDESHAGVEFLSSAAVEAGRLSLITTVVGHEQLPDEIDRPAFIAEHLTNASNQILPGVLAMQRLTQDEEAMADAKTVGLFGGLVGGSFFYSALSDQPEIVQTSVPFALMAGVILFNRWIDRSRLMAAPARYRRINEEVEMHTLRIAQDLQLALTGGMRP